MIVSNWIHLKGSPLQTAIQQHNEKPRTKNCKCLQPCIVRHIRSGIIWP